MKNSSSAASIDPSALDLLSSFLDQEDLQAIELRTQLRDLRASSRVAIETWWQLLEAIHALCPRDDLGPKIGQCLQPHHAGVLGYLGIYSTTLGQALMRFHRFQPLLHNLVPTIFRAEASVVIVGWSIERRSTQLSDDVFFSGLMRFISLLTGRNDIKPILMKSPNSPPANRALYEHFYGCPVEFLASVSELHFPAHFMTLPVNTQDPYLSGLLERQAEAMLQALPKLDPLLSDVQQAILGIMQDGAPTMAQVAMRIGLAERSLYRALEARGMGFKTLVNSLRFELAKDYLCDSDLSLPEISLLLGFADQSVFTRAFRQWSGTTPLKWRKAN